MNGRNAYATVASWSEAAGRVLSRVAGACALSGAALLTVACGQSTLPMEPGTPLTIQRAYCFAAPEFLQAQQERNRDDTLETLSTYDDVEPYVSTGTALTVGSRVGSVLASSALAVGILGAGGSIEMSRTASTALIASGAAAAVLSIGVCIVGEGEYARAVDVYNERIGRKGGAADREVPDKPDPADALENPEPKDAPKDEPKTYRSP
jgi:hypothetical protein